MEKSAGGCAHDIRRGVQRPHAEEGRKRSRSGQNHDKREDVGIDPFVAARGDWSSEPPRKRH